MKIIPVKKISADIIISGDKSISHRAVIFASITENIITISNINLGDDVLHTIDAMRAMGVNIFLKSKNSVEVQGVGLHGLKAPQNPLHCGNSGTTMRLLSGLLCAQKFNSILIGDVSLSKRPMARVAEPLRLMGAKINLTVAEGDLRSKSTEAFCRNDVKNHHFCTAPIEIIGNQKLMGMNYELPIPSAQVKSAILLASLYAQGETVVREKIPTRDHTERMLKLFYSRSHSHPHLKIPGDISSAAFFIVAACITPNSDLILREVGVNPFRTGILDILKLMGANIEIANQRFFGNEPVADIFIKHAPLQGITIPPDLISKAIDEFPVIFIAAVIAKGNTILRGARELRVKESDRIAAMVNNFKKLNIRTEEYDDGILIYGDQEFLGGCVDSFGDHRIAMAFAIAGNLAKSTISIDNCEPIKTSFPNFTELANQIGMKICL